MNRTFLIANVAGIPVKAHILLLLALPLIAVTFFPHAGFFSAIFIALVFFSCIALHELGHSLVGLACGYRIREIVLLPIGGVAKIEHMTHRARDEFLVAAAGPAVSILLGLLFWMAAFLANAVGLQGLVSTLMLLGVINIVLALFNLLPSFPMDGGRIFRAAMTPVLGKLKATRIAARIGQTLAVIFFLYSLLFLRSGLFGLIFHGAIAYVIYQAAEREYQMVRMRHTINRQFFEQPRTQPFQNENMSEDIEVGPPPYEQNDAETLLDKLKNIFKL